MKDNGYFGIGIEQGKSIFNYGTLFRTAQIFDADFLFVVGARFKIQQADTMNSYRNMPVFSYIDFTDFNNHRPFDCKLIGIELTENSIDLTEYKHPKRAVYLLGAEDHGLTKEALRNCQDVIKIYGKRSLNVSVAGSIVIYDRIQKGIIMEINTKTVKPKIEQLKKEHDIIIIDGK